MLIASLTKRLKSEFSPDIVVMDSDSVFSMPTIPSNWVNSKFLIFYSGYEFWVSRLAGRLSTRYGISNIELVKSSADPFIKAVFGLGDFKTSLNNLYSIAPHFEFVEPRMSGTNFVSETFDWMLKSGLQYQTILLIILIPLYILLFLICKQIIGLSFAGDIFNPLAFVILWHILGLKYGLGFIFGGIALGVVFRSLYKGLYIPGSVKSGLFYTSMAIGFFLLLYPVSIYFPNIFEDFSLGESPTSVLPFILLIIVIEILLNWES